MRRRGHDVELTPASRQTSFGELLKRYRIAAGLSQEALAEQARLSVRGISDLERGINRTPRRETVDLLAGALRLSGEERGSLEASIVRRRGPPAGRSVVAEAPALEASPQPVTLASQPAVAQGEGAQRVPLVRGRTLPRPGRLGSMSLFGVLALLLVIGAGAALGFHAFRAQQASTGPRSSSTVIVVADFTGPDPQEYRVTDFILNQLIGATAKYRDVRVQALGASITEHQGGDVWARSVGLSHQATMVLWGWYSKTATSAYVTAHLQVLSGLHALQPQQQTADLVTPSAELDGFQIQTALSAKTGFLTLLTLGVLRYAAHDYAGAISRFSDALAARSPAPDLQSRLDTAIVYFYRGNARAHREDFHDAIQDFDAALQFRPAFASKALYNRGEARLSLGDDRGAAADFTATLRSEPSNAGAYYDRGLARFRLGDKSGAVTDFSQVLALHTSFDARAHYLRGDVRLSLGDNRGAVSDFTEALRAEPANAAAYYNRGLARSRLGDKHGAVADFSRVLALNASFAAKAYYLRGEAWLSLGDDRQAESDFTAAPSTSPANAAAIFNRGVARAALGDGQGALQDWRTAAELYRKQGNRSAYQQTLQHIARLGS